MQAALFGSFKLSFTLFLLSFILLIQDICTLVLRVKFKYFICMLGNTT